MIIMAGLVGALFTLVSAASAVLVIVCCAPRPRPPVAAAPAMGHIWVGVRYGQSWNRSDIRQTVHALPGRAPGWPGPWVGPADAADGGQRRTCAVGSAVAMPPAQIKQRRQLSGVGRHVIVHGVRR